MNKLRLNNYFQNKLKILQDIINNNVVFNIYNNIKTINTELTKPANQILLLNTIFNDNIYI